MVNKYRLVLPAIAAALIVFFLLLPSEEDKVLALLEEIRTLSEVREPRSGIQQALTAKQVGSHASMPLSFDLSSADLGIHEIADRQQLTQSVLKVRSSLSLLELNIIKPRVVITDDRAQVELLGSALGSLRNSADHFHEIHRLEIYLVKTDGIWLVSGARHIRNERPAPVD